MDKEMDGYMLTCMYVFLVYGYILIDRWIETHIST